MFFFPTHLLHAPAWQTANIHSKLEADIQWPSSAFNTCTHLEFTHWNSSMPDIHLMNKWNSSFSFFCYACLKREKRNTFYPTLPPPPQKKTNLSFKPLIQPPRNWPTKFPNIFEWQKFFTQCRWLFLISSTYLGFLLSWSPWSGLKFLQSCSAERINQ